MWNSKTLTLVGLAVLILGLFYGAGRTKPKLKKGEQSEQAQDTLNASILLTEARRGLDSAQGAWISDLERRRSAAKDLAEELSLIKLLSRTWNEYNRFEIGALYAVEVAKLQPSAEAWSIAGTTYGRAFFNNQDMGLKRFAAQEAIEAFKQAMLLEPDSLQHALNEATMWIELSSVDAKTPPMKGVGLLRDLEARFPDNVKLNMTLGRLSATRSGDLEKALPRFEKVIELAQNQTVAPEILLEAHYFLADIYAKQGKNQAALPHFDACIKLTEDQPELQTQLKAARENLGK